MGWNDHLSDKDFNFVASCPKCGKKFKVVETEQIPGCRFPEDMVCPYCGEVVRTSMEYEYSTFKMEKDNENKTN